jgi:hypothetical protein
MPITESSVKGIIEELKAAVEKQYAAKSAGWPAETKNAGDKAMQIVLDEVTQLLSGDYSGLRDALVADVVKALKSGKGPVSSSLADIA